VSPSELSAAVLRLPRVPLAHLPTPVEPLPRLSSALGDVDLRIKRDDATGLALGGSKARMLEFTLGEALAQGADCIVQGGDAQSNHCRQAAAAAARLGLEAHLVLQRSPGPPQGSLLLDGILGAEIHWTDAPLGPRLEEEKDALGQELRRQGRTPYVIGGPRGKLLGAAAYALQVAEWAQHCAAADWMPDAVYVCSSAATHAGLAVGVRALGLPCRVQALAPIRWGTDVPASVAGIANGLSRELGLDLEVRPAEINHSEDYVGEGYGIPTREARVAIELVARTEGLLLDPVYTGKAMAGLIDHVRRGVVRPGSRVLFIHTGGLPALFAHARALLA